MNLISMDNDDYNQDKFFGILINKSTYSSILYLLVGIPLSILLFIYTLSGLIIGLLLLPIWLGVPILIGYFKVLWLISKMEEYIYDHFLEIQLPKISKFNPPFESTIQLLKHYASNIRTWKRFMYFFIKPVYSIIFSIPVFLLLGLGISMVYIPIESVFGHINFYNFYQTDSFIEVIFIYFCAVVVWISILHLVRYSVRLTSKIAIRFLCR